MFRSLKIVVDKQDNASVDINNKPSGVLLFVLYNCDAASNLKLVFEGLSLRLHRRLVIITSEFNLRDFLI